MTATNTPPPNAPPPDAPSAAVRPPLTPARRRMLQIVGPLLVVSVVFAGLILAQDQLPGTRSFQFSTKAPATALLTVETGRNGVELEFRAGPTDQVGVYATGGYSGREPTVAVAEDGSRVDVECPSAESYDCGIRVEIEVPAGTAVTAHNRAGRIAVEGISGALDLTARNGHIEITGAAGPIEAHATNGRVLIEDSTSARVTASTRNGNIRLGLTEPRSVDVSTVNGEILIDLGACVPYAIDVHDTMEYSVSVPTDDDSPRKITARTHDFVIIECG